MNPATDVLLLDVDGVLIDLPDFFCSRFPPGPVGEFFAGGFQLASTGQSSVLEHLPEFMWAVGRGGDPQDFYREWLDYENRPNREVVAAAAALKDAGWRIYLATNQEALRVAHLLRESGFAAITDGHFASYSVGHRKPSHEYYGAVTAALGVSPKRIIFWDDSAENVAAAQAAGWAAHLFTGAAHFRQVMGLDPA